MLYISTSFWGLRTPNLCWNLLFTCFSYVFARFWGNKSHHFGLFQNTGWHKNPCLLPWETGFLGCLTSIFVLAAFIYFFVSFFTFCIRILWKFANNMEKGDFLPAFGVHITYLESKTFHSQPKHLECEAPKCCPKKPTPPPQLSDIIYGCSP